MRTAKTCLRRVLRGTHFSYLCRLWRGITKPRQKKNNLNAKARKPNISSKQIYYICRFGHTRLIDIIDGSYTGIYPSHTHISITLIKQNTTRRFIWSHSDPRHQPLFPVFVAVIAWPPSSFSVPLAQSNRRHVCSSPTHHQPRNPSLRLPLKCPTAPLCWECQAINQPPHALYFKKCRGETIGLSSFILCLSRLKPWPTGWFLWMPVRFLATDDGNHCVGPHVLASGIPTSPPSNLGHPSQIQWPRSANTGSPMLFCKNIPVFHHIYAWHPWLRFKFRFYLL
jgi:hypothetical protein